MSDTYNGWTNRETWLVALWINNDQGWQESVHDSIKSAGGHFPADRAPDDLPDLTPYTAGEAVRENVEGILDMLAEDGEQTSLTSGLFGDLLGTALARVNWTELGESFLRDLADA